MIFGINETFHVKGKGIEPQIMVRPSRSPMLSFLPRFWMVVVGLGTSIVTLKVSSWGAQKIKAGGMGLAGWRSGGFYLLVERILPVVLLYSFYVFSLKGLHIIKKR